MKNKKTLKERFEEKYKIDEITGCWNWIASLNHAGYGQIGNGKKVLRSSRVSYELHNGSIPNDMFVLHTCDNRKCVNPKHLWLGNHQDNMDDRNSKNRQAKGDKCLRKNINSLKGEKNPSSILTNITVEKIRQMYKTNNYSTRYLSRMFNCGQTTIMNIVNNKTWKHI